MSSPGSGFNRFPHHIVLFLAPATIIYTLFMVYPLLDSIRLSLYTTDGTGAYHFTGLANYIDLVSNPQWSEPFWNALKNNFIFFSIHMLVQNPIGIMLAALLSLPKLTGRTAYRTLIFMPTMLSVVIIGFIWQLILSPLWGVSEGILGFVGLADWFQPWLGQENSALITLSLISVWQFVGIPMMLIYAAMLNIPHELEEGAIIDGATHWDIFWHIKLPLILPTIAMISILTFVANFNAFDLIYSVKGALAGPNFSTDIMGTFFYRTFFGFQLQLGNPTMGATVATMMFLVILAGVLFYLFVLQRKLRRYAL
ncbi:MULTISPECIES: sugar ABC transporter permease [unclassified Pseudodesulfovibrio]|uniref:carbohydrate ABC transporter permease n=1 Tax=unclassified Pseudodesulfovibrio TaxID=2661612 RepID=UPI000FEC1AD0|nr:MULTISPECIES: sugar ABC transporter permease [unclassified Pseudodesulfovibrio]MCJ2163226.1 sugar ABC transporter permease [Pseudodesulfovibrio sp. S3-i]RWU07209.1 sugar ABC transporter permease [Pseudodesulfovibrio sp. S3]